MDVLFLDFSIVHHITVLLHFSIYQASVLEYCRVPCVCFSGHERTLHFPFNYYSVYIFPFGCLGERSRCMVFLLYSGGQQIICFSDIVIAEYLSIASGCEYSRMLFLDPGFHPC